MNDVLSVRGHKDLTRFAKIEFSRVIAEEFAVDRAPDETPVGVDVDLGNSELGGREVLFFIDAAGVFDGAAGVVDTINPLFRHGRGTMHDEREVRLDGVDASLDFFQDVEVETLCSGKLEGAVRSADSDGERVDARSFNKFSGLVRVGQLDRTDNVFFDAAELSKFRFNNDALRVGGVDDALDDFDVLFEFFVRGVDHDGAVEAAVDAVVADFFGAMVEMNCEDSVRKDVDGGTNHALEEVFVGVSASAAGNLNNEGSALCGVAGVFILGRFAEVAAEKTDELLEIVDVIRANSVFAMLRRTILLS